MNWETKFGQLLVVALVWAAMGLPVQAVDVAPRISDREIIESLADIRGELALIREQIKQGSQETKQLSEETNRQIKQLSEETNRQIKQLSEETNRQIKQLSEETNRRFAEMDRRFEGLTQMVLVLHGTLVMLIIALFGYIFWDRRTMVRPLINRIELLERDAELRHKEGSLITRLHGAWKALGEQDSKVVAILKKHSLS